MKVLALFIFSICFFFQSRSIYSQEKHTLSGHVKDATNGETLIGATFYIKETSGGTSSNAYGFYSLTLPAGTYLIEVSYIGYQKVQRLWVLDRDARWEIELAPEAAQLSEVIVTADAEVGRVESLEMSTAKMDIKTIVKMPAFLGEADVVKSLLTQPGVSTVGEGASGFNVRGGTVGQNLLLLDEAPVYNSSHMLGFFSAFNPDAVKDVKLYKGGIPARYGGRLSSLLDIRMKEGNNKEFESQGGVGTVFSRLSVEAPIVKDKGSFLVAGRRSYIDVLAAPFLDDIALYFYDLTAKANYNLGEKDRIYASGYFGRDVFDFGSDQGLNWGSQTGTLRWNHIFSSRLFANFTGIYSKYDYELQFGENESDRFKWNAKIANWIFKPELSYFINSNNEITFGAELIRYYFTPGTTTFVSNNEPNSNIVPDRNALEWAAHLSNSFKVNQTFSVEYGLRFSNFQLIGEGYAYEFESSLPGERKQLRESTWYERGETIQQYNYWEPRLSLKFQVNDWSSVKTSYNRTVQYVHLISNTVASNPLDIWQPSTNNIKPQIGDQYALGYFRSFGTAWEFSAEGFYRDNQNQIDYINGAELLRNQYLEGDVLTGDGRAYGLEFYLQRKTGKLTGWMSYTLSRSELKVDGINYGKNNPERDGMWYPALYDRTHNLSASGFYQLSSRWSVSSTFTYSTGTPSNAPTSKHYSQGIAIPYDANYSRNAYRLPDYHRLDIAFRLEGKTLSRKGKVRQNHDYWVFSLYNVYGRRNAFSVDFVQSDGRYLAGQAIETEAIQTSILGSIVPSVSYNFKF
jgi:hypothetical protein